MPSSDKSSKEKVKYSERTEISTGYLEIEDTENSVQRILSGFAVWAKENDYSLETDYDWMNPKDKAQFEIRDDDRHIAEGKNRSRRDWGEPPTGEEEIKTILQYGDISEREIEDLKNWFIDLT